MNRWISGIRPTLLTALVIAMGYVLGAWANATLPAAFLVRPMVIACLVAGVLSCAAAFAGRQAGPVLAAVLTILVLTPASWQIGVLLAAVSALVWLFSRSRGRPLPEIGQAVVIVAAAFAFVGVVQAVPAIMADASAATWTSEHGGDRPILILMLDGYPRADTIQEHGGNIDSFLAALEERGFDHYAEATSPYDFTDQALWGMLRGPEAVIPGTDADDIRPQLTAPEDFLVIDPPLGHVTMWGGDRVTNASLNDFEAYLLGRSVLVIAIPDATRIWVLAQVSKGLTAQVDAVDDLSPGRIFVHLVVPHPPFQWGQESLGTCWPETCDVWQAGSAALGLSRGEYWERMNVQLAGVNELVLRLVDRTLDRSPDAVVVLFSDHGSRWSQDDHEEWGRSFFAARTPGYPSLFDGRARPDAVLQVVREAYP